MAIRDVADRLAHDTTALCRNIAILTDILIEDADDPARVADVGAQLRAKSALLFSLVRMGRRVTQVALHAGDPEPVDLEKTVTQAILRNAGRLGGLGNRVEGTGTATVDMPMLDLALDAALENVGDHGPGGGTLCVRIRDGAIDLLAPADRPATEEDFAAFSGRDRKGFGGLGLWLAREVMQRQGGQAVPLDIDATTFAISLQFKA
ncbi:hypothetical protein [uncultured Tateyamaria sp.]|uniref:hypothetical protein n=1 Tax=uncultured Tateyamaria sp. TaxID=455651 RepID=UPI0026255FC6|nr:hypothetical protein [uncultured Tateyamaria sp.]